MNKKLITIVSLVLALIFIMSLSLIFTKINNMATISNNELSIVKNNISRDKLYDMDGAVLTGAEVKSLINNHRETPDGIKLSYAVNTGIEYSSLDFKSYGYGNIIYYDNPAGKNFYTAKSTLVYDTYTKYMDIDPSNKYHISDECLLKCVLVKTTSGTIIGAFFKAY